MHVSVDESSEIMIVDKVAIFTFSLEFLSAKCCIYSKCSKHGVTSHFVFLRNIFEVLDQGLAGLGVTAAVAQITLFCFLPARMPMMSQQDRREETWGVPSAFSTGICGHHTSKGTQRSSRTASPNLNH